jgi:cardiolipin synthase
MLTNFSIFTVPAWMGLFLVLYYALVIVIIIAEDREPTTTLAWILVLIAFPLIGIIIYFFAGRDWKHTVPKRPETKMAHARMIEFMSGVYEPYLGVQKAFADKVDDTLLGKISNSITAENDARPLPVRTFDIYPTGQEFFDNLKKDLSGAKRFIHMQYFIWEHDILTAELIKILSDRAKAGVEVRLTYDWMGSLPFKKDELKSLSDAGGIVVADVTQLGSLNYRNHRKITVIDGEIGYTGGHNIGQEYIDGGEAYPAWRDTSLRVTGPGVAALQKWFAYRWMTSRRDGSMFDTKYFPAVDASLTAGDPLMVQVVAQGVDDPWESSRRTHMIAVSGARKIIRMQSPYFVPGEAIYDALVNAALAGVEVQFMMTGWPDHKSAFWAAQSYWSQLIEAGGHVFTYEAGFMHSKTLAIDSEACAIGTMNMDLRSLRLQRELMMWCFDAEITRQQEAIFDADLANCKEITLESIAEMGPWIHFRNSASRLAANIL